METAREKAQRRQNEKALSCEHPDAVTRVLLLIDGGYVEYCTMCGQVTDLYESM